MKLGYKFGTAIVTGSMVLGFAGPVLALDATAGAGASVQTTGVAAPKLTAAMEARISKGKEKAGQEIDRRVTALTELNEKVQAMAKVSADVKASIASSISNEINTLTALKAKIDADADLATLKADIQSITKSYRVFMLVIPQSRIMVAADKVNTVVDSLTTLAGKLQARIASAGSSLSADATTSLTDMNAKIADAKTQADAAVAAVASLKPDNGDKASQTANASALKDARAKLKTAMADIEAARKDAHNIVKALHDAGASANAGASAEASGQAQTQ